ncbi:hypothetical protein A2291_05155 [candidate division WOR-1 bacterium RIFOXYB2_FULL_42_35]|uniref:Holo-[acyl-carrier-protein] synthase n=1 Tax=candidate division WOR-1 bacterium RIFOXYC2_FULL_41_25 TaxID=1802586 RepID=A0A1F4TN07_UNCSA|nr:MAG: hypothetical protein A2247_00575 [candidate division WOR-1 bacterium RIFOXYA2_FULL_41_14]OGC24488.1 MAG: hypothetical protein A2291_05155 [candidate division WOR-1 bacterium RIFOXYB2_FULL_42_35]OGC34105.1 MAG: hypothetical protein A2462_01015 [candidate division WOR-1 bacterium RIFOXYC2_FULL_41_25]
MIKGIGIDIIEISRIKEAVEKYGDKFLSRVYTPQEIAYCKSLNQYRYPELAVRFAAKEAYSKAVGTGIGAEVKWTEVEIINNELGKPHIAVKGKVLENVHVSLSHSRDSAVAQVVIEA